MEIISPTDFFAATMGGRSNKMDMSQYEGYPYLCACGNTHVFYSGQVEVLRELPNMRLVFQCPDRSTFVTCVKVKGIFSFKGFDSLFGSNVEENLDVPATLRASFEKRTGVKLDEAHEETKPERESPRMPVCPHCGAGFNPTDYRQDAPKWHCSQCGNVLPKE
jgi:hypothetical protein